MTIVFSSVKRFALITVAAVLVVRGQLGCRETERGAPVLDSSVSLPSRPDSSVSPSGGECAERSSCAKRHYCSADRKCICVESAEGVKRCAKIPETCHMKLCKTSADCADVGPGYFCDTPDSGCCTDPPKELARCVAPCGAGPGPGPSSALTGTWTGTTDSPGVLAIPVRLQIEKHGASVSGKVLVASPGSTQFFELYQVEGTSAVDDLKLATSDGLRIEAKRTSDALVGTLRFPPLDGDPQPYVTRLRLKRR